MLNTTAKIAAWRANSRYSVVLLWNIICRPIVEGRLIFFKFIFIVVLNSFCVSNVKADINWIKFHMNEAYKYCLLENQKSFLFYTIALQVLTI